MARILKAFLADESGATAIEYAIIAGGISTPYPDLFELVAHL